MAADIFTRKKDHFVLWRPAVTDPAPMLLIGSFDQPVSQYREIPLKPDHIFPELWHIPAAECEIENNRVYYYWFKVRNTEPYDAGNRNEVLYCTDPMAYTIDRRVHAAVPQTVPAGMVGISNRDPASVVLYQDGSLVPCDPGGQVSTWTTAPHATALPANNRMVMYELPTRWTRITSRNGLEIGNGTFQDIMALLVPQQPSTTFPTVAAFNNRAHLLELGINALELLPPADSDQSETWGYGTSNFFAPCFYLGFPANKPEPTATIDLSSLIDACHQNGIRFFKDAVMAFCTDMPYRDINFMDFLVKWDSGDPEQGSRDGFGGDLVKYRYQVDGYSPTSGEKGRVEPSREFMKAYICHWMDRFRIDGLRLDSVNNIACNDFLGEISRYSRDLWRKQGGKDENFLVVGEELSVPIQLIDPALPRLDGLWNEKFKHILRQTILGRNWQEEPSFEWSVRKMIDCRYLGFHDGSQAVNYITSHDVGGPGNERLYNYLHFAGVFDKEQRAKLAFVCLLTAVGIPMILAGDEFVDQMDLDVFSGDQSGSERDYRKQVDPVNYSRLDDAWRHRVFKYVCRLVKFRTGSPALSVNDTRFIHSDFHDGKRVVVWQRGSGDDLVVVVANFSDWGTADPGNGNSRYQVPNWPALPANRRWREITQDRDVSEDWAGKEPLFPWEAKVYAAVLK